MPHPPRASCEKKIISCQRRPKDPKDSFLLPRLETSQTNCKDRMLEAEAAILKTCSYFSSCRYPPPDEETMTFISFSRALPSHKIRHLPEAAEGKCLITFKLGDG